MADKDLVVAVFEEAKKDLADLRGVHGGAPSLARALGRICARVEKAGLAAGLKGADKRELAIEAALLALEKFVPAGWLAWVPAPARRFALGWMIDRTVAAFKRSGKWAA